MHILRFNDNLVCWWPWYTLVPVTLIFESPSTSDCHSLALSTLHTRTGSSSGLRCSYADTTIWAFSDVIRTVLVRRPVKFGINTCLQKGAYLSKSSWWLFEHDFWWHYRWLVLTAQRCVRCTYPPVDEGQPPTQSINFFQEFLHKIVCGHGYFFTWSSVLWVVELFMAKWIKCNQRHISRIACSFSSVVFSHTRSCEELLNSAVQRLSWSWYESYCRMGHVLSMDAWKEQSLDASCYAIWSLPLLHIWMVQPETQIITMNVVGLMHETIVICTLDAHCSQISKYVVWVLCKQSKINVQKSISLVTMTVVYKHMALVVHIMNLMIELHIKILCGLAPHKIFQW